MKGFEYFLNALYIAGSWELLGKEPIVYSFSVCKGSETWCEEGLKAPFSS